MAIGIELHGIAQRHPDGDVTLHRPGRAGGRGVEVLVPGELAERHRIATGDVVAGPTAPIEHTAHDRAGDRPGTDLPAWLCLRPTPTEALLAVAAINGLPLPAADDRPPPRSRRTAFDRLPPSRPIPLARGPKDITGRVLDLAAPLVAGAAGLVHGPHGTGLTRTLQAVAAGAAAQPNLAVIVLLLRARSEEITAWRRFLPQADVVAAPSPYAGATALETLRTAELTLQCAQRQTELGRDVLVAIDSLTGLWASLLELEEADAQRESDRAAARHSVRDWIQRAGAFSAEGFLGSGLGGSLTIVAAAWNQEIDAEAEEEGESHPHLRLIEHVLNDTDWRVPLSGRLAARRLYPAVDIAGCISPLDNADGPAGMARREALLVLREMDPLKRHATLLEALEAGDSPEALLDLLPCAAPQTASRFDLILPLLPGTDD